MDKAAAGKLWDGITWHRPVMDKTRAFTINKPWYGILAGAHIPELFHATLQGHFGLRERLTACFELPTFLTIQTIRNSCVRCAKTYIFT